MARLSLDDIEKAAAEARTKAKVRKVPVDPTVVAKAHGAVVIYKPFADNTSGLLLLEPNRAPTIVVNEGHHLNRQRFSIGHEIGHLVLHGAGHQRGVFVDRFMVYLRADINQGDPQEWQANTFAGALLLPKERLMEEIEAKGLDALDDQACQRLARKFRVSMQALTIRMAALGVLNGP